MKLTVDDCEHTAECDTDVVTLLLQKSGDDQRYRGGGVAQSQHRLSLLGSFHTTESYVTSCHIAVFRYVSKAYIAVIRNHFFGNNSSKPESIGTKFLR